MAEVAGLVLGQELLLPRALLPHQDGVAAELCDGPESAKAIDRTHGHTHTHGRTTRV